MTILAFLALWFVASVVGLVLLIVAVRAFIGGEKAGSMSRHPTAWALNPWDDWDHQSERGGW